MQQNHSFGVNFMLHIDLICVGKLKESYLKSAISEYSKRLSKYCTLSIIEISDEPIPEKLNQIIIEDIKNKEGKKILKFCKKSSYLFVLDLKGHQFTSEEFAKEIENISLQSNSHITFVIGGSLRLSEEVLHSADKRICFSKMTFPHQLIRVFLLEQLFRSFKILNHETYHR